MMALATNGISGSYWADRNFRSLKLGDKRRSRRVVRLAEALAAAPGKSIPRLFTSSYDAIASYDLFSRPEATPDALQAGHRQLVAEDLQRQEGTVLLISDTTTISFTAREKVEGLGPVGNLQDGGQGFLVHSMIAARYCDECTTGPDQTRHPLDILGLATQKYVVRSSEIRRGKKARKHEPGTWNESRLWEEGVEAVELRNKEKLRLCHVGDRENDIYEFFLACKKAGHGFVIRAGQNRALDQQPGERLLDHLREQQAAGEFSLNLRARPGSKARTALLKVAFGYTVLRAPYRKGLHSPGKGEAVEVWAVRVWEESENNNPIEWILLTDTPVETFEQARQAARIYSARWVIEEFHKCLKTGLGAERLQLETAHRLQAAVAIYSVVALRLLVMREKVRQSPDEPAEQSGLTPRELTVLQAYLKKTIKTVKDAVYGVARLGGHFQHNGSPGWQTLWHGMTKLRTIVEGVELQKTLLKFDQ